MVKQYALGQDSWFLWCHKRQVRGIAIESDGSYFHNGEEIYTVSMSRTDIEVFDTMMRNGMYKERRLGYFTQVWEQSGVSLKEYIRRLPLNTRAKAKHNDTDGIPEAGKDESLRIRVEGD